MFRTIIAAVAVLAVAGGAAFWAYVRGGDDGAEAEVQVIRWVNVTVEVPSGFAFPPGFLFPPGWAVPVGPGLVVTRDFGPNGPVLAISSWERRGSGVGIDAETGKIIKDATQHEDRAAIDAVLETLTVSPLDRSTLPWPYNGEPPNVPPEKIGNITFIPPDPAAGIRIIWGTAGGDYIEVNNGRSLVFIGTDTGAISWEPDFLVPEDKDVLKRFLSTVKYVGTPVGQGSP